VIINVEYTYSLLFSLINVKTDGLFILVLIPSSESQHNNERRMSELDRPQTLWSLRYLFTALGYLDLKEV
jgi:hypothetical protein